MQVSLGDIARALSGSAGLLLPGHIEPDLAATAYFEFERADIRLWRERV